MTKFLQITITGTVNAGKTTAAIIIERALMDAGFAVEPIQNRDGDVEQKRILLENNMGLAAVQGVPVVIQEVKLARSSKPFQIIDYISLCGTPVQQHPAQGGHRESIPIPRDDRPEPRGLEEPGPRRPVVARLRPGHGAEVPHVPVHLRQRPRTPPFLPNLRRVRPGLIPNLKLSIRTTHP